MEVALLRRREIMCQDLVKVKFTSLRRMSSNSLSDRNVSTFLQTREKVCLRVLDCDRAQEVGFRGTMMTRGSPMAFRSLMAKDSCEMLAGIFRSAVRFGFVFRKEIFPVNSWFVLRRLNNCIWEVYLVGKFRILRVCSEGVSWEGRLLGGTGLLC